MSVQNGGSESVASCGWAEICRVEEIRGKIAAWCHGHHQEKINTAARVRDSVSFPSPSSRALFVNYRSPALAGQGELLGSFFFFFYLDVVYNQFSLRIISRLLL